MHQYLIPDEIRLRVYIITSGAALLSAWLLSRMIAAIGFPIPWYVDTPSVLAFLGLYLALYDRLLWKTRPIHALPWLQIPNLSGTWNVHLRTSHEEFGSPQVGTATIRQTFSRISISLDFPLSSSCSFTASLLRDDALSPFELLYHYQSNPKPGAPSTMAIHYGTTRLSVSENASCLTGDYYTGRGRLNYGSIEFTRGTHVQTA